MKEILYLVRLVGRASPGRLPLHILNRCVSYTYGAFYGLIFMRFLVNAVAERDSLADSVAMMVIFCLFGLIANVLGGWYSHVFVPASDAKIDAYLREMTYTKAVECDMAGYEQAGKCDERERAFRMLHTRAPQCVIQTADLIAIVYVMILNLAAAMWLDPQMFWLSIPFVALNLYLARRQGQKDGEKEAELDSVRRQADYMGRIAFRREYAQEARTFPVARLVQKRFHEACRQMERIHHRYGLVTAGLYFAANAISQVCIHCGLYAYIAWRYLAQRAMTLGDFTSATGAITNIIWFVSEFGEKLSQLRAQAEYVKTARTFLEEENRILSGRENAEFEGEIQCRNVHFAYPGSEKEALRGVTLRIGKGEHVALVGLNGSGKSTLVKLLTRLYDPTQGEISMDGRAYPQLDLVKLRGMFACAFQDSRLFALSAAENVCLGSEGNAENALRDVGLALDPAAQITREFDGQGINLSGGQAQRLMAARVLASGAPVAILDEPSAMLDPIAEKRLYAALGRRLQGKTALFVTHRLASAALADRIVVMDQGRIVEEGNHEELIWKNGLYARLYRAQAERYRLEAKMYENTEG